MASQDGIAGNSRLAQMQMKFQQKQLLQREQKKQALAADDESLASSTIGKGKVRQMFDDRRRGAGIDRSNPLKPIATTKAQSKSTAAISNNNNSKRSTSTSSRYYTSYNQTNNNLATTTISTNSRLTAGKDNSHHFDTVDHMNNELDFAKLHITPNQIRGNTMSDRNNNNNYKHNSQSMVSDIPETNGAVPKRHNVQANALKLNPVIMKKSPNVSAASTATSPTVKVTATRNRRSSISSTGTINGGNNRLTTAQSPTTRTMATSFNTTASRNSGDGTKKTVTRTSNIGPRSATFKMAAKPPPRVTSPPAGMGTCRYCHRHFNDDRLAKHEDVCRRMISVKRKVFDATTHRIRGTEAEQFLKKNTSRGPVPSTARYSSAAAVINLKMEPNQAVKKSNWRKKHEEFILAIREAKKVQAHLARGGKLSDLPPPPPSDTSDYIQCPHCGRRFNQEAAERHIPKCANMRHNKPKPPQKR